MISPTLLHIYGTFGIKIYGVCIVTAIIITLYLLKKDKVIQKLLGIHELENLVSFTIISAVIGARLLYLWEMQESLFSVQAWKIWEGGFSVQGSIIACLCLVPTYLYYYQIPIMQFVDRVIVYVPLLQSISRLGCFFAGCCYGKITTMPWHIVYTHPESLAPLYAPLHPTQLYSSGLLFLIFYTLYIKKEKLTKYQGSLLCLYLAGVGMERFIVDFLRDDRGILYYHLSLQQWIAFMIMISSYIMFLLVKQRMKVYESI